MKILELQKKLEEMRIPDDAYSILKGGLPNEQLCLVKNDEKWEIYYSERGKKSGVSIFENEDNACDYFFEKLKKYSQI